MACDNVYVVTYARSDTSRLLREARRRAGLTQAQLAIRAGTKQAAISRLERGVEEPTVSRLGELLWVMGFDLGPLRLQRRPIPGDPVHLLSYALTPIERRGDLVADANELAAELAEAGRRSRQQELLQLAGKGT